MLELAQDNRLLHAVVSATHGADTELLPLLTTHAESLLAAAKLVVAERVAPYDVGAGRRRTSRPRSTWSCGWCSATSCSRPAPPAETADDIAWIAARGCCGAELALARPSASRGPGPARPPRGTPRAT